jgi:hypothetical protein
MRFTQRLHTLTSLPSAMLQIDPHVVQRTYRWDIPEVVAFKYLFNFVLTAEVRNQVVHSLFTDYIAPEASVAPSWYVNWDEAHAMQDAGMVLGGHSPQHQVLATLSAAALAWDVRTCQQFMHANLHPQADWPFSYPYGKTDTFNTQTMTYLRVLGVTCAFCTEVSSNTPGSDLFAIRCMDCKDVPGGRA